MEGAASPSEAEAESKLAQVMRNTMGARSSEIESIKRLASEQQRLGVIGDEIQLSGECCGVWIYDHGKAIEIKKPEIMAVNTTSVEMKELTKEFKIKKGNDSEEEKNRE